MFQRLPAKPLNRLRAAIALSRSSESLRDIPDRLARIIERFNSSSVNPEYRADIFQIIEAAISMSESMVDDTYDAQEAIAQISSVMTILPRVINHLTTRPTTTGFSIMNPATSSIYPQIYSTEGEAIKALDALQQMGAARHCIAVPVKVHSTHAIQPRQPRVPVREFDPETLPTGILPPGPPTPMGPGGAVPDFAWEEMPEKRQEAAGPDKSIPIDVQSETVSLPNSPAQA